MRDSEKLREEALKDNVSDKLEKNDMLALILSGFLTVGLPCLLMLGIIAAVVLLLFARG